MRLIFAGTPDFAAAHLKALLNSQHSVLAVLTQPDRKSGRGQKITPSPVKKLAQDNKIIVHQPLKLRNNVDVQELLVSYQADLMIVVAYGLILPKEVLNIPRLGCLNVHASLLPRWRGSAPIQRAIQFGDSESGVSIMQMDEDLDTGAVLSTAKTAIAINETSASLHDKLAQLGQVELIHVLDHFDKLHATPQNDEHANYAHKLFKDETRINWSDSAIQIHNKIRAFNPWPVCNTQLKESSLRIWRSELLTSSSVSDEQIKDAKDGQIIAFDKSHICVKTGEGLLSLVQLQKAGSQIMDVKDFINGVSLSKGDLFV